MEKTVEKIYFLGPIGSYSQIALNNFQEKVLKNAQIEEVSTIKKILNLIDENENCYAVVPIENSIEGIVRETIDNLLNAKKSLKILSQTVVEINHCLLSKGKKEDIKYIASHPQALAQCQKYISDNFSTSIELIPSSSTSNSAKEVANAVDSWASIANEYCAKLYNLSVIDTNINDCKNNYTRFILLGHNDLGLSCNRTSLAFSTKNEPGALLKILEIFKKYDLNLIYLESRPSKHTLGEYVFFADIDKGEHMAHDALEEISENSDLFRIFGSYSVI